jgi:hypothetical protein
VELELAAILHQSFLKLSESFLAARAAGCAITSNTVILNLIQNLKLQVRRLGT